MKIVSLVWKSIKYQILRLIKLYRKGNKTRIRAKLPEVARYVYSTLLYDIFDIVSYY